MKKILLCLIALSMFTLTGCSLERATGEVKITPDEVMRRLQKEGDNSFLLVLTTTNCYSCDEYEKVVKELQKEKEFPIYSMDINKVNQDKLEELKIILGEVETLPMTYYFDQGTLKKENVRRNYIEIEVYKEWLKSLSIW